MRTFHDEFLILRTDGALARSGLEGSEFAVEQTSPAAPGKAFSIVVRWSQTDKETGTKHLFKTAKWCRDDANFICDYANTFAPIQPALALAGTAA